MATLFYDYWGDNYIPALRDLEDPMGQIELADWHEDLHVEIEWMRKFLLPEIEQGFSHICKLLSQTQEFAFLEEDKRFLEFAISFLALTRKEKIKWPKKESFDIVRRIKSYVLQLWKHKNAEQYQTPVLWHKFNKEVLVSSVRKWRRLAERHEQMSNQFLSLKIEFFHIVGRAHNVYNVLALKNRKKYFPLAWNFGFCLAFLSYSGSDMLLFEKDQLDYYERRIRTLVNGVDSTKSLKFDIAGADTSRPNLVGVWSTDWHEDLHKKIELARKTDLPDIRKFQVELSKKCEGTVEKYERSERKKLNNILELAEDFLELTRGDNIEWSRNECYEILSLIKLYALRYRNESLAEQCEKRQQIKMGIWTDDVIPSLAFAPGESTTSVEQMEVADWHEDLHKKIESTRREYLSDIEEIYRRICKLCSQGLVAADKYAEVRLFVESGFEFLALTRNDKIIRPKNLCFMFVEQIKLYGVSCRNIIKGRYM